MKFSSGLLPVAFSCLTVFTMAQQPLVIAHRGFSFAAPENTLSAFQAAIDIGAPYFELDVQSSKEGIPMVLHDETLDKTASSGHRGAINERSIVELNAVHVGYPKRFGDAFELEPLPTLRQALALAKSNIRVCVEIKVAGIEAAIVEDIRATEMTDEVIIFSFLPEVLESIHAIAPELPLLFLKEDAGVLDLDQAMELHASAIGVGGKTDLNKSFLQAAKDRGLEVWRWTVDDPAELQEMMKLQVAAIITNRPDLALSLLQQKGR